MKADLFAEQPSTAVPVGLMLASRLASMVVGLAALPALLHGLGTTGFAAWAVMLAIAAFCSMLELGKAPTFVKHSAPAIARAEWDTAAATLRQVLRLLAAGYACFLLPVMLLIPLLTSAFHVPDGRILSAGQMVGFVYGAVALRALLQFGSMSFNAARRFRAYALVSFLQSATSNVAAAVAALATRQLDIALLAYWSAQLLCLLGAALLAAARFWRGRVRVPAPVSASELLRHGLKIQVYEWAQMLSFQFDKLVIASLVGLPAVAVYEVGSRGVTTLRSAPVSGLAAFLSAAAIDQERDHQALWNRYLVATQLAGLISIVFLLLPAVVAPLLLFAWTGVTGYEGRWVFLALLLGATASVIAVPATALAQAAGRAALQAKSAMVALLINVPLSIAFAVQWGLGGVAVATSLALTAGALLLLRDVHRENRMPLSGLLATLAMFRPALVVASSAGLVTWIASAGWLEAASVAPSTLAARLTAALAAVLGYGACLLLIGLVQLRHGALGAEHYDLLARVIRVRWFVAWCERRRANLLP